MADELPAELANLGKELQCPICLGILSAPCARLPCCHYFCLDCITESLKHKTACPTCKMFARKRDVMRDSKVDRIAGLYAQLEAACGSFLLCSQPQQPQQHHPQQQQQQLAAPAAAVVGGRSPFVVPSPPGSPTDEEYETAREEPLDEEEDNNQGQEENPPAPQGGQGRLPLFNWRGPLTPEATQLTQQSCGSTGAPTGAPAAPTPPVQTTPEHPLGALSAPEEEEEGDKGLPESTAPQGAAEPGQQEDAAAPPPSYAQQQQQEQQQQQQRAPLADLSNSRKEAQSPQRSGPAAAAAAAAAKGSADIGSKQEKEKKNSAAAGQQDVEEEAAAGNLNAPDALPAAVPLPPPPPPLSSSGPSSKILKPPPRKRGRKSAVAPPPATPAPASEAASQLPPPRAPPSTVRRVPSRLLPWACHLCTLENAGTAKKCAVCETPRHQGSASATPPAGTIAAAEAAPSEKPKRGIGGPRRQKQQQSSKGGRPAFNGEGAKAQQHQQDVDEDFSQAPPPSAKGHVRLSGGGRLLGRLEAAGAAEDKGSKGLAPEGSGKAKGNKGRGGKAAVSSMKGEKHQGRASAPKEQQGTQLQRKRAKEDKGAPQQSKKAKNRAAGGGKGGGTIKCAAAVSKAKLPGEANEKPSAPGTAAAAAKTAAAAAAAAEGGTAQGSPEMPSVWEESMRGKWVVLSSGITDDADRDDLAALVAASGARMVSDWDASVTHVVCGTDSEGRAKRTAKFLLGVLQGAWVVSAQWARECMLRGSPVPEDSFELRGATEGSDGGPARGRERKLSGGPRLLEGRDVVLSGSFGKIKSQVSSIVMAAGGRLLPRVPPDCDAQSGPIVICEGEPKALSTINGGGARGGSSRASAVVSLGWLMDSVATHRLQPIEPYLSQA